MNEYIYFLRLVERLQVDGAWTKEDEEIIKRHVNYLSKLKEEGKLVLAGRTQVSDAETVGIVIVYAKDEDDANSIMSNDPAVKEGIMKSELTPFHTAFK